MANEAVIDPVAGGEPDHLGRRRVLDDDAAKSVRPDGTPAKETASGHTDAKDEEPIPAKSEELRVTPSARVLADLHLLALTGQEGV